MEKTEQHCWGSLCPAGLQRQQDAKLPLQTPALHLPRPLHLATAPLGCSLAAGTSQQPPGHGLKHQLPAMLHSADTGHTGPCAMSLLLIIGKVGVSARWWVVGHVLGCRRRCLGRCRCWERCGCALDDPPGAVPGADPSGWPLLSRIWGQGHIPALLLLVHWQGHRQCSCQGQAVMLWHTWHGWHGHGTAGMTMAQLAPPWHSMELLEWPAGM